MGVVISIGGELTNLGICEAWFDLMIDAFRVDAWKRLLNKQ